MHKDRFEGFYPGLSSRSDLAFPRAKHQRPSSASGPLSICDNGRLSPAEVKEAYNATAFSNVLGHVLNTHISLTWSTVNVITGAAVAQATDLLLEALENVCAENNQPSAWISVLENGFKRGLHLHVLAAFPMHVTAALKAWMEAKVQEIAGVSPLVGTLSETVCVNVNSDTNINIQWALFRYLMKSVDSGASDSAAARFGILMKHQGPVQSPRLRVARALNQQARQTRGFVSLVDEGCGDYSKIYSEIYWRDRAGFVPKPALCWGSTR